MTWQHSLQLTNASEILLMKILFVFETEALKTLIYIWYLLQIHFIDQISFLDSNGCCLNLYGMSYHQSGQKHILYGLN